MSHRADSPDAAPAAPRREVIPARSPFFGEVVDGVDVRAHGDEAGHAWAIVRVSVSNIRKQMGHQAELGTQALMGTILRVWRQESNWLFVQTAENYFGWITNNSVVSGNRSRIQEWLAAPRLLVTALEDRLWAHPSEKKLPVSDVVAGVLLQQTGEKGNAWAVATPDGRHGFLRKDAAIDFELWRATVAPTPETIEKTARDLLGISYLWGGTSPKGLDCSGFCKSVFWLNGLQLNRDAWQQSSQGIEVDPGKHFENLLKGDLLFFGDRETDEKPITHVGIYLDQSVFIHASGLVQLNSFDPASPIFSPERRQTFVSARRILPEKSAPKQMSLSSTPSGTMLGR